jgi:hypothetical protein
VFPGRFGEDLHGPASGGCHIDAAD